MRAEAKVGVVLGAAVVIVASWYFFQRQTDAPVQRISEAPAGNPEPDLQDALSVSSEAKRQPVEPAIEEPAAAVAMESADPQMDDTTADSYEPPEVAEPDAATPSEPVDLRESPTLRANRRLAIEPPAVADVAPTPDALPSDASLADAAATPRGGQPGVADTPRTPARAPAGTVDLRTLIGATTKTPAETPTPQSQPRTDRRPRPQTRRDRPEAEYVIKRGDSLAILSELHYGSQQYVGAILAANPHIKNANRIFVGSKIRIPRKSAVVEAGGASNARPSDTASTVTTKREPPPVADGMYRVKSGDTLYRLAEKHYGSGTRWRDLLAVNNDVIDGNGRSLRAGQLIRLPAVLPGAGPADADASR